MMIEKQEKYEWEGSTMTHTTGRSLTPHDMSPGDFLDKVKQMIEGGEIHQLGMRLEVSFSDGAPHPKELEELMDQVTEMESSRWNDEGEESDYVLYVKFAYSNEDDTFDDELDGHVEQ